MMGRTVLGWLSVALIAGGFVHLVEPRLAFRAWRRWLRPHFPSLLNRAAIDLSRLPDGTLRYITLLDVGLGSAALWLARQQH